MKKTATIILILAAAVSTGCKGFLDVTPTNKVSADEVGLPVSTNGLTLPCGASGRYICK